MKDTIKINFHFIRYERETEEVKMSIGSQQRECHCCEQEKVNWKAELDQIQTALNLFKHEQVNQQDTINSLKQKNRQLEDEKDLFKHETYSMEKKKTKLEKRLYLI